ncbi:MAG TPA: primary-amine oxidase [Nitrolancea sp.]|nr:primary-amine oxidase [Nitrolancea sp.]
MATQAERRIGHPLDPLSADEITDAVRILREQQSLSERCRFVQVTLREPSKEQVLDYDGNGRLDREAFVIVLDSVRREAYHGVVSMARQKVVSWDRIADAQPAIALDEFVECEAACKQDPAFQAALRRRGITDVESIIVDPWSFGAYEDDHGRRLVRALTFVRYGPTDNAYAHPVENLVAIVDLNEMRVIRIDDYGVVPVPNAAGNYGVADAKSAIQLKPLEIHQPDGPSFQIDGNQIRWDRWQFRIGFTPREGLVLYTIGFEDQGRLRSILYRASLSEMVVPYGDVSPVHGHKNAFDGGEYNIGAMANSLELGCDCLGEIHYFDAVLADSSGEPIVLRNAICMHEEDYGILWKHVDFRISQTEVRRSRRLVMSWITTVGNYEYGLFWYFYQDGTLEFEVKLTGILSVGALNPGEKSKYGQVLNSDGLYAPIHQHFFNVRLDLDVDGVTNSVYEIDLERESAGTHNPEHAGFYAQSTLLQRELDAQRIVDTPRGRFWRIVNPQTLNKVGEPVGYRLVPGTNAVMLASAEASIAKRATFANKNLWVTPHADQELNAAGQYPNQHPGGAGLPEWTQANRSIENTDIVLWYTIGSNHVARLEDWPVMPVMHAGFMLRPDGFFNDNPAMDVSPSHGHEHGNEHANGHENAHGG